MRSPRTSEPAVTGPHRDLAQGPTTAPEDTLASLEDVLQLGAAALSADLCLLGLASPRDRWIRTVLGVRPEDVRQRTAFCTFAMMQPDLVWIPDVRQIPALARLPGASDHARSFVGGPVTDCHGAKAGGLAILFPGPHEPSPRDRTVLASLLRQISLHLAQRHRTERLLAERQQESGALAMLRGLLRASTTVAVIGTDLSGRVTVFSEGAERMFQVPAREALGRTASFLIESPEPRARGAEPSRTPFSKIVEGVGLDAPTERAWRLRRADGSSFEGSITAALVAGENRGCSGYALIVRDITEQRAAEQMKDDFVSMVSHELRTPLTAIRGGLGLLIGGIAGPLSEPVRELIDIAHASSERLLRVVGDILDVQALASGRLGLDFAEVDLRESVERAIRIVASVSAERGVTVALRRAPESTVVEADMGRVVQVIVNLLSNAVKHSPEGGTVNVDIEAAPGGLSVSVGDEGPGVPEEARELLFRKFSRLSREPGGTGLGLAIVKAIVRLHGGQVSYRPGSPSGAIFSFCLPYSRSQPATPPCEAPASTPSPASGPIALESRRPEPRRVSSGR